MRSPRVLECERQDAERERLQNEAIARSIWPTGKPAGHWPRLNECVWLLPFNREYDRYANRWADVCVVYPVPPGCVAVFIDGCITAEWWPVESMVPARTRGIAEGRRLAREREMFAAWLRSESPHTSVGARAAVFRGGPAAFVMRCDWYDLRIVAECLAFPWAGMRIPTQRTLRLALLASPEWAALPWQREGGR